MEYLEHGDLQQCVYGALTEKEARDITKQIAQGLRHLHSQSFTHRDIKPTASTFGPLQIMSGTNRIIAEHTCCI